MHVNTWKYFQYIYWICVYLYMHNSAVAINRMQNKSFYLHNICVCTVYIYYLLCIYKYTHMHVYISEKMLCLYIKYIYL